MTDLSPLFRPAPSPDLADSWLRQQREARAVLRRFERGFSTVLLADEVGMGKTYVALAVMAGVAAKGGKTLLIVPGNAVLLQKWLEEIKTFNASYLAGDLRLRPLLVLDRFELLFGLHEFPQRRIRRVNPPVLTCFLRVFQDWYNAKVRRANAWKKKWLADDLAAPDSLAFQTFCAEFSKTRIHAFLDAWRSRRRRDFTKLCAKNGLLDAAAAEARQQPDAPFAGRAALRAYGMLSALFREFCAQQDKISPNVFVMTMSALRATSHRQGNGAQLLKKYLLGRMLYHKREAGAGHLRSLADALGWTRPQDDEGELRQLGKADLLGLRSVFDAQLKEQRLTELFFRTPRGGDLAALERKAQNVIDSVFRERLHALSLAVIDEVHNWKSGRANGAKQFRAYAEVFSHRLVMSATPFQLHEQELLTLFETVAGPEGVSDPSLELVRSALAPDGPAQRCLRLSREFSEAWKALSPGDMQSIADLCGQGQGDALKHGLTALQNNAPRAALRNFCLAALRYRSALDDLETTLRPVMMRHVRDRRVRAFHCGRDFRVCGLLGGRHHGLYAVPGLDAGSALMNFIGMRAQQLLSRGLGAREHVHLLGGINSSICAFEESWKQRPAGDDNARRYLDFFLSQLRRRPHPKVIATAERALNNQRAGRKTLIFCDRLATQEELCCHLRRTLKRRSSRNLSELLRRDFLAADYYLSRSLAAGLSLPLPDADELRRVKDRLWDIQKSLPALRMRALARLSDLCLTEALLQRAGEAGAALQPYARLLCHQDALAFYLSGRSARAAAFSDSPGTPDADNPDLLDAPDAAPGEEALPPRLSDRETAADDLIHGILYGINIWHAQSNDAPQLHAALLRLLAQEARAPRDSEAEEARDEFALADLLLLVPQGLRKLLLNRALLPQDEQPETRSPGEALTRLLAADTSPSGPWQRTRRFLELLCREEGSIRPGLEASRRRSLWNGLNLRQTDIAVHINGGTDKKRRTAVCAAFNSPCLPDILICTFIGSEGIDLHRECADIVHHDLPWNPALLEQRTGRIDRIGSLASRLGNGRGTLAAGIPFLANDYDEFQYAVLLNRAQKQEILLGKPELAPAPLPPDTVSPLLPLPSPMLEFLHVNLSVEEEEKDGERACGGRKGTF